MHYRVYRGTKASKSLLAEVKFFEDGEAILARWHAGFIERIEDGFIVTEKNQD